MVYGSLRKRTPLKHSLVDHRVARAAGHEKAVTALRFVRSRKHRQRERLGQDFLTRAKTLFGGGQILRPAALTDRPPARQR